MPTAAVTETIIWRHILQPRKADLSPDLARYLLEMAFRESDQKRMVQLSKKAEGGKLTSRERFELEEYIRVADTLALMQSKARLSLKRRGRQP